MLIVWAKICGWWPLFVVAVLVIAASWLLYVVWQSPHRSDLATYGAFAAAVVALVAGWMAWAWRTTAGQVTTPATREDPCQFADLLADAVRRQWEQAASERGLMANKPIAVTWGRPSLPLAGPAAAAVGSELFPPLPGLAPVTESQLSSGQISDLHATYGGLASGRLVIAGAPGSGKSAAALLLVLAALRHREQTRAKDRGKVPVPVLFTAQDWDPRRQPVREWLTGRLREPTRFSQAEPARRMPPG